MDLTVRYVNFDDLPRVNELRRTVSELHAEGRPDIFRPGLCEELRQRVYTLFDAPQHGVIVACLDGARKGRLCAGSWALQNTLSESRGNRV